MITNITITKDEKCKGYTLQNDYDYIVKDSIYKFPKEARDFHLFLCDYKPFCDYLNYGNNKDILFNFNGLKFDKDGLPKVMYGNSCYYNPVTLAQYALCLYGQYLLGQAMSVLARAYKITGNKKYLKFGEKALNFLIKTILKG